MNAADLGLIIKYARYSSLIAEALNTWHFVLSSEFPVVVVLVAVVAAVFFIVVVVVVIVVVVVFYCHLLHDKICAIFFLEHLVCMAVFDILCCHNYN